jgi:hypothetical protein
MHATIKVPHTRRGRRFTVGVILVAIGLVVLFVVGFPVARYRYQAREAARLLNEVIAETDRVDPGWTVEDLEAKRTVLAPSENGALQVLKAHDSLPAGWQDDSLIASLEHLPVAPERLSTSRVRALRSECLKAIAALQQAHKLCDLPKGRFAITHAPNPLATKLPHLDKVRDVGRLLEADALVRADQGDIEGALDSCRALVNCGRAIGDEPIAVSQFVRLALCRVTMRSVERALSQGQASDATLQRWQQIMEQEARAPVLLVTLRAQRALHDGMGKVLEKERDAEWKHELWSKIELGSPTGALGKLRYGLSGDLAMVRAENLRLNTQAVEIARLPSWEHEKAFLALSSEVQKLPKLARTVWSDPDRIEMSFRDAAAGLLTLMTAMACERYRLKYGHWPESLHPVLPESLREVPLDPFDGKPLRYERATSGVVVYSVGTDGGGDRRTNRRETRKLGTDIRAHLYDAEKRRR